ncbi:hypothetical protein [Thalassotalea sp. PLHSN55]|uniref:hypothetical protein n=1 Tax=Thalassotalea sp. PLHSN55 TaxID=3435888 RepID=UPI003F8264A9
MIKGAPKYSTVIAITFAILVLSINGIVKEAVLLGFIVGLTLACICPLVWRYNKELVGIIAIMSVMQFATCVLLERTSLIGVLQMLSIALSTLGIVCLLLHKKIVRFVDVH